MRVLVVGSGGREHALVWKLAQSELVGELFAVPGNPGMAGHAVLLSSEMEVPELTGLALEHQVDLVVVGPEQPLVAGLADSLREAGIMVFGPQAAAARLEGSKSFAKEFMNRHGVPTAASASFSTEAAALEHLASLTEPPVVKKSGLAAGKGVTVAQSFAEAEAAIRAVFSEADSEGLLLEERLEGRELSLIGITDGSNWLPLLMAQDYKYFGEGDTGPMTGGMGAVAPARLLDREQQETVDAQIVDRTLAGLRADGLEFAGVLFIGLMVTDQGVKVLEYNVRFGDPETQSVLPLLQTDLLQVILSACQGRLAAQSLSWHDGVAAGIVMAAPGYPGTPETGIPLKPAATGSDLLVFQAGTARSGEQLISTGGRVLNIVGLGGTMEQALNRAARGISDTDFPGAVWRRDIGLNLI